MDKKSETTFNGKPSIFFTDKETPAAYSLSNQFAENLECRLIKDRITATGSDAYFALSLAIRDRLVRKWLRTQHQYFQKDVKRVYWWNAIETAGKRLLAKGLVPNDSIVAIASTAQWSGTVAVDQDGNAIGNSIIWMDARGAPYIHKMANGFPKVEGYGLAKILKWIQLTGGAPGNSGKDPIAHILYLKNVHPEIYQRTYKFLEPIDYIGLRLTGKIAASFNSLTLNWLTDNRNIENVTYHDGLIKLSTITAQNYLT